MSWQVSALISEFSKLKEKLWKNLSKSFDRNRNFRDNDFWYEITSPFVLLIMAINISSFSPFYLQFSFILSSHLFHFHSYYLRYQDWHQTERIIVKVYFLCDNPQNDNIYCLLYFALLFFLTYLTNKTFIDINYLFMREASDWMWNEMKFSYELIKCW